MKIKISEIFESIQGEGKFSGVPMLFIRLYGCTRRCQFCDTVYAIEGNQYQEMDTIELIKRIKESELPYICWTGGEPLLQREAIKEVKNRTRMYYHHLETNGDLLGSSDFNLFHYLAISPKNREIAKKVRELCLGFNPDNWDIKVVTDLDRVGVNMIKFATMLMPLTTYDKKKDREICKKVWEYCVENNLKFSPRLQTFIYGKKRGI